MYAGATAVGNVQRADGVVRFALLVQAVKHHRALLCSEGHTGDGGRRLEHLVCDRPWRDGLRGLRSFNSLLRLRGQCVESARQQRAGETCGGADSEEMAAIEWHGAPWERWSCS